MGYYVWKLEVLFRASGQKESDVQLNTRVKESDVQPKRVQFEYVNKEAVVKFQFIINIFLPGKDDQTQTIH